MFLNSNTAVNMFDMHTIIFFLLSLIRNQTQLIVRAMLNDIQLQTFNHTSHKIPSNHESHSYHSNRPLSMRESSHLQVMRANKLSFRTLSTQHAIKLFSHI